MIIPLEGSQKQKLGGLCEFILSPLFLFITVAKPVTDLHSGYCKRGLCELPMPEPVQGREQLVKYRFLSFTLYLVIQNLCIEEPIQKQLIRSQVILKHSSMVRIIKKMQSPVEFVEYCSTCLKGIYQSTKNVCIRILVSYTYTIEYYVTVKQDQKRKRHFMYS